MKRFTVLLTVYAMVLTPLYANAVAAAPLASRAPARPHAGATPPSLLEAAEIVAASGVFRAQNTSTITTGRIQGGDKKRSAIAFALSGVLAFAGAGLWRWLPCRNPEQSSNIAGLEIEGYDKCYDADGKRLGLDTPTKALIGAGIGLEFVSLFYLISHLRSDDN